RLRGCGKAALLTALSAVRVSLGELRVTERVATPRVSRAQHRPGASLPGFCGGFRPSHSRRAPGRESLLTAEPRFWGPFGQKLSAARQRAIQRVNRPLLHRNSRDPPRRVVLAFAPCAILAAEMFQASHPGQFEN